MTVVFKRKFLRNEEENGDTAFTMESIMTVIVKENILSFRITNSIYN